MNAIFANTRGALAKTVKYRSSAQFPAERLQEIRLQDRVSFNAHLPDPSMVQPQGAFARDCLEHISALIQATPTTLWLLRSLRHDAIRIWLGLRAPEDTRIIQASFYANEQGIYCKNSHRIVVLAQRNGSPDEIWLIDETALLQAFEAQQGEPQSGTACFVNQILDWSHEIHSSAPSKQIKLDELRILSLIRSRSSRLFVSGCRGVACVLAEPNFLSLYDLEDFDTDVDLDDFGS
mmetsp:Transcript_20389/g.60791  ORF Transcript_20389/g.60791 Transcript_20389/m.60791 type:complete len:235 (+) Transcript_20389:2064-2768(+)